MKKTFKAIVHGFKSIISTIVGWLAKLCGMTPEPIPENLDENETKKLKKIESHMRVMRIIMCTAVTILLIIFTISVLMKIIYHICWRIDLSVETKSEKYEQAWVSESFGNNLFYYEGLYCHGFLADSNKNIKLDHIDWIATPNPGDSLVCFSNGRKRGYFHMRDGHVVVAPSYDHAWIFSEGLAAVADKGILKFIDTTGNVVIDGDYIYNEEYDGIVFHNGYCVVCNMNNKKMGIIDRKGKWVIEPVYNSIVQQDSFWIASIGNQQTVMSYNLDTVIPMSHATFYVEDSCIATTFNDHTQRQYNLKGELTVALQIRDVEQLVYDTKEVITHCRIETDSEDCYIDNTSFDVKQAVATCFRYESESCWYGLMSPDGKVLTPPSFISIKAIGKDLYHCCTDYGRGVILNSQGKQVE